MIFIQRKLRKKVKEILMKIREFKLDKVKEFGENYIRLLIVLM
jgi:hypothetical protein